MEGFIKGFDEVEGPASGPEEPALALPLPVEDVLNPLAIRLKIEKNVFNESNALSFHRSQNVLRWSRPKIYFLVVTVPNILIFVHD